jgi:hypothetical protein
VFEQQIAFGAYVENEKESGHGDADADEELPEYSLSISAQKSSTHAEQASKPVFAQSYLVQSTLLDAAFTKKSIVSIVENII